MFALSIVEVRDYILIAFFGAGAVFMIFMLLIAFLVFRKVGGIMDALRGNLESARATLGNAAATSSLITDAVVKPVIKTSSFIAGVRRGVMFALKLAKRRGGS